MEEGGRRSEFIVTDALVLCVSGVSMRSSTSQVD